MLIIRATLLKKSRWTPLGPKRWPVCRVLSHAPQSSFSPSFLVPFIKPTFWNSYFKILVEPHYEGNDDQFAKYWNSYFKIFVEPRYQGKLPRNHRFEEVFCCWSSERHFEILTIKIAPSPILAQNMANLQNIVSCLLFTVLRLSICV